MNLKKLAGLLLLAAAVCAPTASAVTYEPEPTGFCERQTLRDFLKPFDRMPELRASGERGQIGVGPSNLRLQWSPSLLVGGGKLGFTLSAGQRKPLHLAWTASATFVQVNGKGKPIAKAKRRERYVGTMEPSASEHFQFLVSPKPAFYRVTIAFRGRAGRKLATFGTYYRMMRPFHRQRLATNASAYRAGNTVFARVENYGTLLVTYGVPYAVERLEGSAWVKAPESPDGPWIMPLLWSLPGESGECDGFRISSSMPAGTYRVVKEVTLMPPGRRAKGDKRTLTAEFVIAS
jgi:hypothetical protein